MIFKQKIADTPPKPNADERVVVSLKNLIDLAPQAATLHGHHRKIRATQSGNYLSPLKGRGMEFDEVRLYQAGDDVRSIDWKVTARTGKAHTKIFREERERPVFIAVDNRPAMHFATRGVFKSVQAAKLAGLLAWVAQRQGDRIGGQIFTQESCIEFKPHSGKHGVLRFFNGLLKTPMATAHIAFDDVLARLNQHAKPGSLIYVISDFRGFTEQSERHLSKLARHCEIVLIFVFDPLEKALPETGRYRFTDNQRDVVIDSADKMRLKGYQQRFSQHQATLLQVARKNRLKLILCDTTQDPCQSLR
jgi:uncharacterized protein (DUF58 family)